jgi:glycosyltransferase involved in cell wall biosynthesis
VNTASDALAQPCVGYVVNAFPAASETFLVNELRALEARGLPLVVLAIDPCIPSVQHSSAAELSVPVMRWPSGSWQSLAILRAHAAAALRRPRVYVGLLAGAVGQLWKPGDGDGRSRWNRAYRRLRHLSLSCWLADVSRRRGVVHLHAFYANKPLELARTAAGLGGMSYSFAAHAKDLYTTAPRRLRRGLSRARFAVTCHQDGTRLLRELAGGRAERVMYLPHGTDLARFRVRCDTEREPALLLAVGRLTPKKGFGDLVLACARLQGTGHDFRCVIAGDGRLRGELEALIRGHGLSERVSILGFQTQDQLADWYARASLLVMPSRVLEDGNRDGVPNVVVEAMCSGTPVIATTAGSIPEVIEDGISGRLVAPGDVAGLAAAIHEALERPGWALQLADNALNAAATLDYFTCAAPLARKFSSLLEKRAALEAAGLHSSASAAASARAASRCRRPRG